MSPPEAGACILFPVHAAVGELLPLEAWQSVHEVLGPGPLLRAEGAGGSAAIAWRQPYTHAEHNAIASRIAGQVSRG
jgi:hypothetical protein